MSTRAAIVHETGPGTFIGRHHHFDGYPSGLGKDLWGLYHSKYRGDIDRMLNEHIGVRRYNNDRYPNGEIRLHPIHGGFYIDPSLIITERNAKEYSCLYIYTLGSNADGQATMRILRFKNGWHPIAEIMLDGTEPNWDKLDEL